jgi:hypothetical protein
MVVQGKIYEELRSQHHIYDPSFQVLQILLKPPNPSDRFKLFRLIGPVRNSKRVSPNVIQKADEDPNGAVQVRLPPWLTQTVKTQSTVR